MSFDDFCDEVETILGRSLGLTEAQVADFISPRISRVIQAYQDGISASEAAEVLQETPPGKQNWD